MDRASKWLIGVPVAMVGLVVAGGLALRSVEANKYDQIPPNTSVILERPRLSIQVERDLELLLNSPQNIAYISRGVVNDPYFATITYAGFTGKNPEIDINGNSITLQPDKKILLKQDRDCTRLYLTLDYTVADRGEVSPEPATLKIKLYSDHKKGTMFCRQIANYKRP